MTDFDKTCDVCGYSNYYAGVASASAPISVAWCHICLGMGAEPMMVVLTMDDDPKKVTVYAHFDRDQDSYFLGDRLLPIQTRDGRSWTKRGDLPDDLSPT